MSVFIFLNIFWIITTCLWSSLRVKALFFFLHTGDVIRIKTNETDLKVLFASLWADRVHEEHHEGPGSLRRRFPVLPESSAQKSRAGGGAPEPDRGDDPEPEEGACLDVCMSVRGEWWWHKDRKWENILGNNILVSPDQSFLGFYRAAPCQRKRRNPPQRYSLLGFSLFWEEGVFTHWKRCSNPAVVSSRRMLPRCGAVTPSATGRRCARCWGASTPGPSPSTEPWATSPQESTGSDWRPGFDNLPWSSTTVT